MSFPNADLIIHLDARYEQAMRVHRQLSPRSGDIRVGGEHMDPFFLAEALRGCIAALRQRKTIQEAIEAGERESAAAVRIWNSRTEWQVHRSQSVAHSGLVSAVTGFTASAHR